MQSAGRLSVDKSVASDCDAPVLCVEVADRCPEPAWSTAPKVTNPATASTATARNAALRRRGGIDRITEPFTPSPLWPAHLWPARLGAGDSRSTGIRVSGRNTFVGKLLVGTAMPRPGDAQTGCNHAIDGFAIIFD